MNSMQDARTELRRIGIDAVAGYLAGGMTAWQAAGKPIEAMADDRRVKDLASRLSTYTVLDVRDRTEWEGGHIPGAVNAPAGELAQGAAAPVNGSGPVAVICGTGFRSAWRPASSSTKGNARHRARRRRHGRLARSRVADQGQLSRRQNAR